MRGIILKGEGRAGPGNIVVYICTPINITHQRHRGRFQSGMKGCGSRGGTRWSRAIIRWGCMGAVVTFGGQSGS